MKMINLLVIVSIFCCLSSPSFAKGGKQADIDKAATNQEAEKTKISPARRALAKKLLIVSGFDEKQSGALVKTLTDSIMKIGEVAAKTSTMDPKVKKKDAQIAQALKKVFTEDLDLVSVLTDIYTDIYAREFTEAEMKELIKFYETDTGKKWVGLIPQLSKEGGFYGRTVLGPKIDVALNAAINEECDYKLFSNQPNKTK